MPPPPALLHALGQAQRARAAVAFARAARDPMRVQTAALLDQLATDATTAYGQVSGYDRVRSIADFQRHVPVMTPEAMAPWVDRAMRGERAVLTTEQPVYYVRTTGSTGVPKHVPITDAYRRDFQKTVHVALFHLYGRFPRAFTGRALYFVGSRRVDVAPDGTGIGTMSGFNFTELPKAVRAIYAWPYELFEVGDLRTRSWLALALACVGDVSLVAGIFPAPIVYLLRDLERLAGELAHHVERGTLPDHLELDAAQRAFFRALLPPRPDVARRLRDADRAPVPEKVRLAWPKLRLVYCWTAATAGLYVPELRRRVGPHVAVRDAIYSACEAWASIPMGDDRPGGPLAVTSGFFELVPEDVAEKAGDPTSLPASAFRTLDQVEEGRRYYIVPTTRAGLTRYWLGDVVEVSGFHHRVPRVVFVRKGGAATNLVGEKLDESHVNEAVGAALAELELPATWFLVAPNDDAHEGRPGYTLHVELPAEDVAPERLRSLAGAADAGLRRVSFDYARVRGAEQLAPLRVRRLPTGSYDRHRQARVAAGQAEAQLKIAHLAATVPADLR